VEIMLKLPTRFGFSLITKAHASTNSDWQNGDIHPLDIRKPAFNLHHAALLWAHEETAVLLVVTPVRLDIPRSQPRAKEPFGGP
jgi:hypothetical protein